MYVLACKFLYTYRVALSLILNTKNMMEPNLAGYIAVANTQTVYLHHI